MDGRPAGVIEFADHIRARVYKRDRRLRALGLQRVILLSGDDQVHTESVARAMGIAEAHGKLLPEAR